MASSEMEMSWVKLLCLHCKAQLLSHLLVLQVHLLEVTHEGAKPLPVHTWIPSRVLDLTWAPALSVQVVKFTNGVVKWREWVVKLSAVVRGWNRLFHIKHFKDFSISWHICFVKKNNLYNLKCHEASKTSSSTVEACREMTAVMESCVPLLQPNTLTGSVFLLKGFLILCFTLFYFPRLCEGKTGPINNWIEPAGRSEVRTQTLLVLSLSSECYLWPFDPHEGSLTTHLHLPVIKYLLSLRHPTRDRVHHLLF